MSQLRQSLIYRLHHRQDNPALYITPNPMQERIDKRLPKIVALAVKNKDIPEVWVFAGNGSGKTAGIIRHFVYFTTGEYPKDWTGPRMTPPVRGRIVCTSFVDGIEKVILPELRKWMPKKYLLPEGKSYNRQTRIYRLNNGSTIDLMSYDQDIQSFAGPSRDLVWHDEHGKKEIYYENKARLRGKGLKLFFDTLTPIPEQGITWEVSDIFENLEMKESIIRGSTYDNADNLGNIDAYVSSLTKDRPEEEQKARLYGDPVVLSGLIYPTFDIDVHTVEPFLIPKEWPKFCVCDPHDRKPFALGWYTVDPTGDIFFYDEWPPELFHKMRSCEKVMKDYASIIRLKESQKKIIRRLIDPNFGKARKATSGTSVIEEFDTYSLFFEPADDNIETGHLKVRDALYYDKKEKISTTNKPKVYFFNTLRNFIYGLTHYSVEGAERPKYTFKDFPDLVRYALLDNPQYYAPKTKEQERREGLMTTEVRVERGVSGYGE